MEILVFFWVSILISSSRAMIIFMVVTVSGKILLLFLDACRDLSANGAQILWTFFGEAENLVFFLLKEVFVKLLKEMYFKF